MDQLLHKPARRVYKRPFYGLVGKKDRAQRAVDIEVASQMGHGKSLDQSRRRPARRLAEVDEKFQRLLAMYYEMNVQYISHSELREESHNLHESQTLRYTQGDNHGIAQKIRSTTLERKGFTLIELLVVIAVIALLMAI